MRFANSIKIVFGIIISAFMLSSCIKEAEPLSTQEREKISLDAWIKLHKPELMGNYQAVGGYYVEILEGDKNDNIAANGNNYGSEPLMRQDTCWVYTNMTGRDINGSICLTRKEKEAELCGTFSYSTHYVPFFNYCGNTNVGLLEGTYLAMRHELTLSDEYCAKYNIKKPYYMRRGSKIRIYLPSSIAYGESGSTTQGGYEGQYTLSASRPLVLDIEVLGAIKNPSKREEEMVRIYTGYGNNPAWVLATKPESERVDANDDLNLKGLYYNLDYNPANDNIHAYMYLQHHDDTNNTQNPYVDDRKYALGNMSKINDTINKILLKRFGKGLDKSKQSEKTQVTRNGRAHVWYVLRFMDGFVVDTNIAEIRKLMFDESEPDCSVFSYSPSDDEGKEQSERQAIGAWYYCIPQMHYGAYGQIVTTSGYAYGIAGLTGTTTTTEVSTSGNADYYNAINYYNYYNYYNSYYNYYSPYYNYYDYNYYNYNYDTSVEEEVTTTKTISTEILPYTPLVFTLFVESND